MTLRQKLRLTILLSMPAIIAQLSFIAMQIIDAAMLGHLSTNDAAAVGLVSTTIWLFGGLTNAFASGFSVQVAHRIGAGDNVGARNIVRQGFALGILFSLLLCVIGCAISPYLPHWLGAPESLCASSAQYFTIFSCGIPFVVLNSVSAGSLRCSGNTKTPGMLMMMMCMLDIFFNYLFIYRFHLGTAGAAYATLVAYLITSLSMFYAVSVKDKILRFSHDTLADVRYLPRLSVLSTMGRISSPIAMERLVITTAQITVSSIIAPMGAIAIAANTFAINIESLCYMPGYGIAEATTTLVGQSKGARKPWQMRSFAWICVASGVIVMSSMAMLMYLLAPQLLSLITSDASVIALGSDILRIEAWAEPGFAAAIVTTSVFVGIGRTFAPSMLNLLSIWCVRITLTLWLAPLYGLRGVWLAMAAELLFRGSIFILRLLSHRWERL